MHLYISINNKYYVSDTLKPAICHSIDNATALFEEQEALIPLDENELVPNESNAVYVSEFLPTVSEFDENMPHLITQSDFDVIVRDTNTYV